MKKIEKLDNSSCSEERYLLGIGIIADKVNEIIDRLNQSVSQPEVKTKSRDEIYGDFNERMKNAKREVENNTEEWEKAEFKHEVLCSGSPEWIFGEPYAIDKLIKFLNENKIEKFTIVNEDSWGIEIIYRLGSN